MIFNSVGSLRCTLTKIRFFKKDIIQYQRREVTTTKTTAIILPSSYIQRDVSAADLLFFREVALDGLFNKPLIPVVGLVRVCWGVVWGLSAD